jgi:hypothetical protein
LALLAPTLAIIAADLVSKDVFAAVNDQLTGKS